LSAERPKKAQQEDPAWSRIIQNMTEFGPHFTIKNDILYRGDRVCLPRSREMQRDVFHDIHDSNGHLGFAKSFDKLSKQWYRTGMTAALKSYIQSCPTCAGAKKSKQKPQGDMTVQRHTANSPFDAIALDVFPLPMCRGYDACLTITDIFTKAVILRPPSRDMAIGMLYRNCSSAAEKSEKMHRYKKATSAYMCALALIEGNKSWKWWGLKAVVGATSFSTTRKRSSHDESEDLPKSKKIATKTLQQEYRPVEVPANHVSKPSWSPSVVDKRQVTGVLLMSSSGRWK
jgi:hypothetical protein